MIIPDRFAYLAPSLSTFAARMAATASLPTEQLTWKRPRPVGPTKPRPRSTKPAPRPSRQYARATPTTVIRDTRLTPGARLLAMELRAVCGRDGLAVTTRRYLCHQLGVCMRTLARYLAELRAHAYVATVRVVGESGQTIGLQVECLDPLLPSWEIGGDSRVIPNKLKPIKALEERLAKWWQLRPCLPETAALSGSQGQEAEQQLGSWCQRKHRERCGVLRC